ncbi:hypothetical protein AAVH_15638 [Aphelenchoides avenae]|nr:hypothetical protein AAVH_15638 [Aphelenchus avenae]
MADRDVPAHLAYLFDSDDDDDAPKKQRWVRRTTRNVTPVKSYAEEQANEVRRGRSQSRSRAVTPGKGRGTTPAGGGRGRTPVKSQAAGSASAHPPRTSPARQPRASPARAARPSPSRQPPASPAHAYDKRGVTPAGRGRTPSASVKVQNATTSVRAAPMPTKRARGSAVTAVQDDQFYWIVQLPNPDYVSERTEAFGQDTKKKFTQIKAANKELNNRRNDADGVQGPEDDLDRAIAAFEEKYMKHLGSVE